MSRGMITRPWLLAAVCIGFAAFVVLAIVDEALAADVGMGLALAGVAIVILLKKFYQRGWLTKDGWIDKIDKDRIGR